MAVRGRTDVSRATLRSPLRSTSTGGISQRRSSGMTLLELMAALIILGLLLTLVRPAVNSIFSARWRLRTAAHQIEAAVHWARNAAAVRGRRAELFYHVPDSTFWVGVGDKMYSYKKLPRSVRFERVSFGEIEVVADVARCLVYPDGTLDAHEVTLQGADGLRVRMTFERLTGEADYHEESDE